MNTRPNIIFLEPGPGAPETGPTWCQHDVWSSDPDYLNDGPPVEYLRLDQHKIVLALLDKALADEHRADAQREGSFAGPLYLPASRWEFVRQARKLLAAP